MASTTFWETVASPSLWKWDSIKQLCTSHWRMYVKPWTWQILWMFFYRICLSVKCSVQEMAVSPPFDLLIKIRKRRLRFLGHILHMEPYRLVQRAIILALTKGGTYYPKGSLFMDVENPTLEDLVQLVQNRYSCNLIFCSKWLFLV